MAQASVRFDGFSRDFNVPTKDFSSMREVSTFNAATEGLEGISADAKSLASQLRTSVSEGFNSAKEAIGGSTLGEMVANAADSAKSMAAEAKSAGAQALNNAASALGVEGLSNHLGDITRMAKSEFENVVNLAGASDGLIKNVVNDVFSGFPPDVVSAINSVGNSCRRNALGAGLGMGNNFRNNRNCQGLSVGGTACPPGATKGLLGTLGNDVASALNRGMQALKKAVQGLASLLSLGYSANLCNVLSSVMAAAGIDNKSVISYAAAGILNKEGLKGSVKAALDMAKNNVGSLSKLSPLAISKTAVNMSPSIGINSSNIKHASESIMTAFDEVDPQWRRTENGEVSLAKLGSTQNPTTAKLLDYQLRTTTFDNNDLDSVVVSEDRTFAASYALV